MTDLSAIRLGIENSLLRHDWYKNTDSEIKDELLGLPEDFNGFLEGLAERPDEIGEIDVQKLLKINYGNYLIIPVFEVRSNLTNQVFTYEYVSWKTGETPGMRGVIFLETEGKITHFLVSKAQKFSIAKTVYDSIGGLFFRVFDNKPQNLPKKMEQEICFHLGLDKLKFNKVIDLGKVNPDFGLSNNSSSLFAAIIDVSEIPNLTIKWDFRTTHKPIGFELEIVHISELGKYINEVNDAYFLASIARLLTHKEIELEY